MSIPGSRSYKPTLTLTLALTLTLTLTLTLGLSTTVPLWSLACRSLARAPTSFSWSNSP